MATVRILPVTGLSPMASPPIEGGFLFVSQGPTCEIYFLLRLLWETALPTLQEPPTPPRGDAVIFSYQVLAYSDTDFHRADLAPSRAHERQPRPGTPEGSAAAVYAGFSTETPVVQACVAHSVATCADRASWCRCGNAGVGHEARD